MSEHLYQVKNATLGFLGRMWEENYKRNLPTFRNAAEVGGLMDKFKGIPAVVVGAGPSLDRNVKYLETAKGKALIIACDTALKILADKGITPDIVVNLDPQPEVMNFFHGINTRGIALVAPTVAYPGLRESWRGHFFYYNKHAPDIPLLAKITVDQPQIAKLTPGGSVLSVAFDLAVKTGADPIAFIGQDLSYPEENAYAGGSHFGDYQAEEILGLNEQNVVEEPDIFGRKLKTQKSMAVTNQWFTWAFKAWNPDGKRAIYNCSESGILTGCDIMPFSRFVAQFARKPVNIPWAIKKATNK